MPVKVLFFIPLQQKRKNEADMNQTLLSHYANGRKRPRKKQQDLIISGLLRIGDILQGITCKS